MQQCISLHITLPQIIPLQNDPQALKIMFPAAQNDLAKKCQKKAKNKTNLQQCISLHITLSQITLLQNDTKTLKLCSQLPKIAKPKMPEKSQKQNKLATVYFTTYYPATIYTLTTRPSSIKNYVFSCSK